MRAELVTTSRRSRPTGAVGRARRAAGTSVLQPGLAPRRGGGTRLPTGARLRRCRRPGRRGASCDRALLTRAATPASLSTACCGRGASLGVEPLARTGAERESCTAHRVGARRQVRRSRSRGRSARLHRGRDTSRMPGRGGARLRRELSFVAPCPTLGGRSFEDWLACKSTHFRSQIRRDRRRSSTRPVPVSACANEEELARRSRGVRRAAPRPLG